MIWRGLLGMSRNTGNDMRNDRKRHERRFLFISVCVCVKRLETTGNDMG